MGDSRYASYGTDLQDIRKLLPPDFPHCELAPAFIKDIERLPVPKREIVAWTAAIAAEFERENWQIPGFEFASYGLADPIAEGVNEFCVIAWCDPNVKSSGFYRDILVSGHSFNIFVRPAFFSQHSPNVHPYQGRTTCYATAPRVGNPLILTAKHVLEAHLKRRPTQGDTIPLADGTGQMLVDPISMKIMRGTVPFSSPGQIDAAVVETPQGVVPSTGTPFSAEKQVAVWEDTKITFPSGTRDAKVTSVTDTRGSTDPRLDIRVFFDQWGVNGDSGSLILNGTNGVAIYTGEITTASGNSEGVGQHLEQARVAMNLTLLTG